MTISLTIAALAISVALAAESADFVPPPEYTVSYYRSRVISGVQCLYTDGEKAILFRRKQAGSFVFVRRFTDGDSLVVPVKIKDRNGPWDFEMNGGVTTYHSFSVAVTDLLDQPLEAVSSTNFDAFLARAEAAPCKHKTFDIDLYEK
jgi:hypothetical protein